ncbi:MAG TPA: M20/M25/M40 family metallo-hydrolase [Candidatus Dormibacteraeota bacterium]|nr:M20/M25/M40 family metallo-hydrolase [Candidatus Dormibacteraeota bacterium]
MTSFGLASRGLPSDALEPATWERAQVGLVATLRDLIRLRTVNPPGDEIVAARYLESALQDTGLRPEVVEPFPGRGSIAARLRGDGTGGEPLLLLSHLDVVPAPPERWTHDPFAADVADGYVWGRGAVDMKAMVAMEVEVLRLLAAEARAAGRDPSSDPIPGLRRDVLFASTADEEAGGVQGAAWLVERRPELLRAAGALNEAGGVSVEFGGRRFYPIQVAEKGYADYRITVHGAWGHGSVPRPDNAAVRAATIVGRLAAPGPPRVTPVVETFFDAIAAELDPPTATLVRRLLDPDPTISGPALAHLCDPMYALAAAALLRDTISPDVVHAGVKYNVIPGAATIEIDCRTLPGTDEPTMRQQLRDRIGEELWSHIEVDAFLVGPSVEAPTDTELYGVLDATLRDHDPDAIPVPAIAPFATDAKHTRSLTVPTYGFSPLRLDPAERFLERFHGVDERVSLEALRFGLPVLYDVVRRFCG